MSLVTSSDNPQFKLMRKLAHSGRERRKAGLTLLDGMHLVKSWQDAGLAIDKILVKHTDTENAEFQAWRNKNPEIPALFFSAGLFNEISGEDFPSGVIGLVKTPSRSDCFDLNCDSVVLDGVQDPGNLGTLLRSAAAAGINQVLLSSQCAQAWGPKSLRSGMGAQFSLRIHESVDLPDFLSRFKGTIAVTDLHASMSLFQSDLKQAVAWVFGSEGEGVSVEIKKMAHLKVKIPMPGHAESLNVAAAASVCLFEMVRQRMCIAQQID